MGFESYRQAKTVYLSERDRLTTIAIHVRRSDRGSFLKLLADAWLHAKTPDQRILREAWSAVVTKYSLEEGMT